jgi:hypothetical protein
MKATAKKVKAKAIDEALTDPAMEASFMAQSIVKRMADHVRRAH